MIETKNILELSSETQVAECSGGNVNTHCRIADPGDIAVYNAIETDDRLEKAAEGLLIFDGHLTSEEAKRYANDGRDVTIWSSGFAAEIDGEIKGAFETRAEAESYLLNDPLPAIAR